jgi:hypothetical protein
MNTDQWVEEEAKYLKIKFRKILNKNPATLNKQERLEYLKAYAIARRYFPNLTRKEQRVEYETCKMPMYMTSARRTKREQQQQLYDLHLKYKNTWKKKKDDGNFDGKDLVGCAALLSIISYNNKFYDSEEVTQNTRFILERNLLNAAM